MGKDFTHFGGLEEVRLSSGRLRVYEETFDQRFLDFNEICQNLSDKVE
jgi:hypothetical protein